MTELPVASFLPQIRSLLRENGALILHAAPGAGKTTLVPGALAEEFPQGRIALIEPRRVAAAAAAARIAALKGEQEPGGFAGFQVRGESRLSNSTRVVAMTPGVLLRQLQNDPELSPYSVVIFDEFHERSWECDLLLALIVESRRGFREDLRVVIMSATLDSKGLKELLDGAPELHVPGREYPVTVSYSEAPSDVRSIPVRTARAVRSALPELSGDLLVFLPGAGEIARTKELLAGAVTEKVMLCELHGGLTLAEQNRALRPAPPGIRKVILATNVAESSLTVENVTAVIDCGFERKPQYFPDTGLTFLSTVKISQASAAQRSGRAGRTTPGSALRLWTRGEQNARIPFTGPEILNCDLTRLVLETALWGTTAKELPFLDTPPKGRCESAVKLLQDLGALDAQGHPTARGRELAALPVAPRIGNLLLRGKELGRLSTALRIAALLESGVSRQGGSSDLRILVEEFSRVPDRFREARLIWSQLQEHFRCGKAPAEPECCGTLVAAAFPERIAKARRSDGSAWTLRGGRGGTLAAGDTLRSAGFLAVAELSGSGSNADGVIRLAAPLSAQEVEEQFGSQITLQELCFFDEAKEKVCCVRQKVLGAIVLNSTPVPPDPAMVTRTILRTARKRNIPLIPESSKEERALIERLRFASRQEPETFGDWDEEHLGEKVQDLLPELRELGALSRLPWGEILRNAAGFETMRLLDKLYPEKFRTPAGAEHRIDYSGELPALAVRLQEMLGVKIHPVVGIKKLPLKIELLSPAQRVIQVTSDLPGFWAGSYALVRKEMRSAYPKHEWPEDPAAALPMLRSVKKRV